MEGKNELTEKLYKLSSDLFKLSLDGENVNVSKFSQEQQVLLQILFNLCITLDKITPEAYLLAKTYVKTLSTKESFPFEISSKSLYVFTSEEDEDMKYLIFAHHIKEAWGKIGKYISDPRNVGGVTIRSLRLERKMLKVVEVDDRYFFDFM